MSRTTVALYDDLANAQQAVRALKDSGFPPEDISLVAGDASGNYGRQLAAGTPTTPGGQGTVTEAATANAESGAVFGGLAGLIIGLASLVIPGVGPVIAGGWLATTLIGAGVGAAAGGLVGALTGAGVPETEARAYSEAVRNGRNLVAVVSADEMARRAADIMARFNPAGIEQEPSQHPNRGPEPVPGENTDAALERARYGLDQPAARRDPTHENRENAEGIPDADIGEEPVDRDQGLSSEALDGGGVEYGVNAEDAPKPGPVAGNELTGEEQHAAEMASFERFDTFTDDFRRHYDDTYLTSEYSFDELLPAYRYGYDLALSDRFAHRKWDQIEPEARQAWEQTNPASAWDDYREAVHQGWDAARNAE